MIRLLEDRNIVASLAKGEIFGTRVYSDLLSGTADLIWWDGKKLLLGLKNGVMSISGEVSDPEELREFVSVIGPQVVMCLEATALKLSLPVIQTGVLMRKEASGVLKPLAGYYPETPLMEYHELLDECDMAPDFAGFCRETSKALSTGAGIICEVRESEKLIAALIAVSVTESAAIINAVAVHPAHRRRGLGRKLLSEAEEKLSGRELFILREESKNEEFYRSCGYENIGRWCVLTNTGEI